MQSAQSLVAQFESCSDRLLETSAPTVDCSLCHRQPLRIGSGEGENGKIENQ
jgi:hypothetical protein